MFTHHRRPQTRKLALEDLERRAMMTSDCPALAVAIPAEAGDVRTVEKAPIITKVETDQAKPNRDESAAGQTGRDEAVSGGMQQRLAIARSLSLAPPILIMDEPACDLDPALVDQVLRQLSELNDSLPTGPQVLPAGVANVKDANPKPQKPIVGLDGQEPVIILPPISPLDSTLELNPPEKSDGDEPVVTPDPPTAEPPLLDRIPYLSRLFKNVGVERDESTLMLMVTPRIIIQEEAD